jgi:hypothetical protein
MSWIFVSLIFPNAGRRKRGSEKRRRDRSLKKKEGEEWRQDSEGAYDN